MSVIHMFEKEENGYDEDHDTYFTDYYGLCGEWGDDCEDYALDDWSVDCEECLEILGIGNGITNAVTNAATNGDG